MILDPKVLSAIADLELVARVTVDGTVSGLHRSPFHGYSAEFSQYRHYRPGDDLKYIDWKLLARTDRIYTKQYRETTNLVAEVAIDASASMAFAGRMGVSKLQYARLLGAALAHLVSTQGDAVGLVVYDEQVRHYIPARGGQAHLRALLVALSKIDAGGGTAAGTALRRAVELMKRRGLLVVLSDLYDEDDEVGSELKRAARIGHELAVFHVLTREELDFPYDSDIELEELETGQRLMTSGRGTREAYRVRFAEFVERWRARCLEIGAEYTLALTEMPLDAALRRYLLKRLGTAAR